jgi:magnesium transporter
VLELRRRLAVNSSITGKDADSLTHALFDITVDDFHPVVERLDDEINEVQEQVLAHPDKRLLEQTLLIKRRAQRVRRTILPQRDVAARLARGEYPELIKPGSVVYFRDIYDHTLRVEEMIEVVRDVADSTLSTYLGAQNNRTNEVMKTLAIVTAIFLPLTLIVGVYGTNFDNVPEYRMKYAYPLMWGAMITIVLALLAWFRWRKWI